LPRSSGWPWPLSFYFCRLWKTGALPRDPATKQISVQIDYADIGIAVCTLDDKPMKILVAKRPVSALYGWRCRNCVKSLSRAENFRLRVLCGEREILIGLYLRSNANQLRLLI
ncbi:hypothetical protein, partial [Ralstonia pickettii]|uniref:hypothetical protein n=1 Tax=Ralstonia pickettii TaxID=329 RepID=UPI001C721567